MEGKTRRARHRALEQRAADLVPAAHVARAGHHVRSTLREAVHGIDVGGVIRTVTHRDQHVLRASGAETRLHGVERATAQCVLEQAQLRKFHLQPLDHRHSGVFVEVVDHKHFERPGLRLLHDATQRGHDVLALVIDGDDHAERRRLGAQIRRAWISSRIHGMTSSSTSSSEVVASNPSSSRALRTSGTRICTSCS